MDKRDSKYNKKLISKRPLLISGVVVLCVAIIGLLVATLSSPERSVESYCKVYKEVNEKLANAQGDTYSVAVFSHKSSNPADFANAFAKLEQVAPDEIQSDIKTLKQIFQKVEDDPSQAFEASLSGLSAENQVKQWTDQSCKVES